MSEFIIVSLYIMMLLNLPALIIMTLSSKNRPELIISAVCLLSVLCLLNFVCILVHLTEIIKVKCSSHKQTLIDDLTISSAATHA